MPHVVVLGSGTPNPEPGRGGSAVAIADDKGAWVLIDCGRAATQRAIDAGLDLASLVAVFITHHHSDHISDLATLATARWTAGAASPIVVVAPDGPAAVFAERCLDPFDQQAFYSQAPRAAGPLPTVAVHRFDAPAAMRSVYEHGGWEVAAATVDHHPVEPAVGYRIEHAGLGVTVSGDTAVCAAMYELAHDVDVLVHEALLTGRVAPELLTWNASARAVGELAARTSPEVLVLTHLIPAPRTPDDEQAYVIEARAAGFEGRVLVAHDLMRIDHFT